MSTSFEIQDNLNEDQLIMTKDEVEWSVGIDLNNTDYQEFLEWNDEQQEPLTLPETWPTPPE